MQMDFANDEVPQRPGRRIKLFRMETALEEEEDMGSGGGGEHPESPPPHWLDR